jgi:nucleotide-binding universal stress UspA family protein
MQVIKKILFPTDFSTTARNAFAHCLAIAGQTGAKISLIHAIYPEYEGLDIPVLAAKATQEKIEAARLTLQSFAHYGLANMAHEHSPDEPLDIDYDVAIGSPVNVIANAARRDQVNLIIMGAKGQHNALEKAFGSVTTGVIERANCPVLVIPEEAPYQDIKTVAFATDLRESDAFHFWKTGRILEGFSPIVHVVHIDTGKNNGEVDLSEIETAFSSHNSPVLAIRFHQVADVSVEKGLTEFVDTYGVDILVMYAPQHNLLERIFIRSETKRMALRTHIPLLLIKTPTA